MKTNFPEPHNPERLPLQPGYRWLGRDEEKRPTDEIITWSKWEPLTVLNGVSRLAETWRRIWPQWSIRRALSVDDPLAPPPEEFAHEGYEMITSVDERAQTQTGWQAWYQGKWCFCPTFSAVGPYYHRRPVSNPNVSVSTPNPMNIRPYQHLIVNVGTSQILAETVKTLALDARPNQELIDSKRVYLGYVYLRDGELMGAAVNDHYYRNQISGAVWLDARTQLGKLIDLLEEMKRPPAPTPPKVCGSDGKDYEGVYVKGAGIIKFGCAEIATNLLRDGDTLMSAPLRHQGNRSVKGVLLDSGVIITKDQIKAILEYVDAVNKAS